MHVKMKSSAQHFKGHLARSCHSNQLINHWYSMKGKKYNITSLVNNAGLRGNVALVLRKMDVLTYFKEKRARKSTTNMTNRDN